MFRVCGGGLLFWLSSVTMAEDGGMVCGVELPGLLARAGGELADQVLVGIAQDVAAGGKPGDTPAILNDGAQASCCGRRASGPAFRARLISRTGPGSWRRSFSMLEAPLQGLQQLLVLECGALVDTTQDNPGG